MKDEVTLASIRDHLADARDRMGLLKDALAQERAGYEQRIAALELELAELGRKACERVALVRHEMQAELAEANQYIEQLEATITLQKKGIEERDRKIAGLGRALTAERAHRNARG